MSAETIARRYARALFELAREQNKLDELVRDLDGFAAAWTQSAELRELVQLPGVSDQQRQQVLEEIGKTLGAGELAVRAVGLLAARQRLSVLPDLLRLVREMVDQAQGVLRATVTSATPLDPGFRDRLVRRLEEATGRKVDATFREDPTLIAGIVTQIGDRVVDGSLRGKLRQLAESLRAP
jgi:F-type H+-transporting ATPase subunit delta